MKMKLLGLIIVFAICLVSFVTVSYAQVLPPKKGKTHACITKGEMIGTTACKIKTTVRPAGKVLIEQTIPLSNPAHAKTQCRQILTQVTAYMNTLPDCV